MADEEQRRPVDLAVARHRGEEFGQRHFYAGTAVHKFPSRPNIEQRLREWMLCQLELSELDHARLAAAYEGARAEHERLRQQYLDAIKSGDMDTVVKIEAKRDEHDRQLREHMHNGEEPP